jgi:hypothetical protein
VVPEETRKKPVAQVKTHCRKDTNFRIIAAQISLRHNYHCRNLDAELIDFVKRHEKLRHMI